MPSRLIKETLLLLALLAAGLFGLPALIFFVGKVVVGEYDGGLIAFYQALADSLAAANGFAWLLIASPYLIIQLFRFWLYLGRHRRRVTEFKESAPQ